ncbi:PREDICTED: homeobox-leucine zipper protein HAT22-like [Nelumbo nucifera]|uniref:Homeobox-leucine zipper protein HAT22-like n=2 Tax=Nelumbo nucifera TaxID=4432 RepID=A0A1U7ZKC4_NELNU|nr:PREDICTED: homeobox-leucine zipper protein HAT22-like [Nelumbo nucifera]DAD48254.1 TPA_asm: hypothetical protein HUJ06_018191 [Nelumbo nucifera]
MVNLCREIIEIFVISNVRFVSLVIHCGVRTLINNRCSIATHPPPTIRPKSLHPFLLLFPSLLHQTFVKASTGISLHFCRVLMLDSDRLNMGFGDLCNTGLSLGLASQIMPETRPKSDHPRTKSCLNFDKLFLYSSSTSAVIIKSEEPLLTLSLSDDKYQPAAENMDVDKAGDDSSAVRQASPHSGISSFSNASVKRERDHGAEEVEVERVSSRVNEEDDQEGCARKKLRLTKEQSALLEESFKEHHTLNPKQKQALAKQLNLRPRQVEVWFQNRRARTKLKQTEVDCEFLKKCCESLTDENRRLKKELQELKALKLAQPLYMQLPAATLTMCPSCERIGGIASDGSSKAPIAMASKPHFYNSFTHPSAAC